MAFDYSLRFTGQDDLSGVLGKVKKEIKDMGKEASNVELVDKAMGKIITSSGKLNTKVKQTSALLAEMKFDGDYNAEQFLKVAQAAGNAKDAISDTQAMVKFFADDRRWLNTTVQGFQALAGIGSIAAGAMSLFGIESENATRAIQGCQTALSILNGITTVANLLDKEGYLMTAKKILGLNAQAAATNKATAAQAANTTATKAGTLAQLKLNAAVLANPYVLAAAAIAALAAGIVYWVSTMDDATEAQKGVEEAIKTANDATTKGYETYMKNRMELDQLKTTLDNFNGSKEEERSLVDDLNNKYGNTLGKYKDLASWKKALANVSEYQCKLMAAEAKLAALNAEAYSAWAKAMSGENFEENMAKFKKLKEFADDALDDVNFYKKQVSIAINLSGGTRGSGSKGSGKSGSGRSTKTPKTGGGGSGSTQQEETGILAQLNNQLKEKQKLLDDENTSLVKQQQLLKEIADLQTKITRIQNARTAATDGTLADALKPQPLKLTPEIDQKAITDASQNLADKLPTAYDKMQEKQQKTEDRNEAIADSFNSLKSVMSSMGEISDDKTLNAAGTIAQAIATYIMGWSEATAQAASLGPFGWAAFALGTAAQLAAIVAQIHSLSGYASGGIISGGSYYGDQILARVNAGEMVLNRKQQSNLFRAIESGDIGAGHTVLVPEFKIKGSDLYGTLRNFSKSVGKTGKVTGIR